MDGADTLDQQARHLLLVDDDEHILKSLSIYLRLEDFVVSTACNGKEALEKIRQELPHLVILDVMMPEMDGFQVLETMKAEAATANIPVIMLTAKGQDTDVLRGYQKGASSYMTKPVNYDELVDNVRLIFRNEEIDAGKENS